MTDIYLTSTFRNEWNRDFNLKLVEALEERGYSVYVPQRDTEQKGDRKNIFDQDIKGIDNAKMIIAIGAKTQTANWGFEIGHAFKSGKTVVILTDKEHPAELMTEGAAGKVIIVDNLDKIESYSEALYAAINSFI